MRAFLTEGLADLTGDRDLMRYWPKTLRSRLTLLYFLVFAVLLALIASVVLFVRQRELNAALDDRLSDRAEAMAERIELDSAALEANPGATKRPRLIPYRLADYYFQLRREDGTLLEKSGNLRDVELPLSAAARSSREQGHAVFETLSGALPAAVLGKAGSLRVRTAYHDRGNGPPYYLQVATRLGHVHDSVWRLGEVFLWVIGGGLLVGAAAAWLLARRSLEPIGQIAKEAREMGAARLDRRLTLPAGEDELFELTNTLNAMLERLEAAFQAQERFLANAAHELKTPIAVVLGEAQVLSQKSRTPEEYDRFVANVQDEMRHFGQIVNSMLILARADAGLPLASITPVSINEVVTEAVSRCRIQAERQEVRLVPVLAMPEADRPDPTVEGDPELLRAAVVNLIRNAIRHSPVREAVEITVTPKEASVRITVRDHGPGVPEAIRKHLFDRFYSGPASTESSKGIGLGLAIAKGVTVLHKGSVSVVNHPEGGAVFAIDLPLRGGSASEGGD